jgi:Asp-tRNA(Asn)/Glu-tRNA(Gln) amidotransferase A subunit family amidase
MMLHSASFWGASKNPYNQDRSCSGSSGGDAALVAARCVPFSIGADIGGSLRSPAHFNGIYTLRPTPQRLTRLGGFIMGLRKGFHAALPVISAQGALCRSVDDQVHWMRSVWCDNLFENDRTVAPMKFNEEMYKSTVESKKLRIGYFDSMPCLEAS